MVSVTMKELLESGAHMGHQVKHWNPKMKDYIFGERNGIHIFDVPTMQRMFRQAISFVSNLLAEDKARTLLFVGSKRQAQSAIREAAEKCGQFYVNERWLGGTLTNFRTVQKSIRRLSDLEKAKTDGRYERLTKKERLKVDREYESLNKNLCGIKSMTRLPDAVFVVDVTREATAVEEARRLGIPVIAVVDTNGSPEGVDYVIPGNDDAFRSVRLFASRIADTVIEGRQIATEGIESLTAAKRVTSIVKDKLETPSLAVDDEHPKRTNVEVRKWYLARVSSIPEMNLQLKNLGLSLRVRAIAAWDLRHQARLTARSMMLDQSEVDLLRARDFLLYGNPDGPTFESLVEHLQDQVRDETAIYEAIIEGSYRTNAGINKILSL